MEDDSQQKPTIWRSILCLLVLIVIAALGFAWSTQRPSETIKIAFIGPLSGDGAVWGEIERDTIELAVEEINQNGGIKGRSIELISEDGKCDGKTAVAAAQKVITIDKIRILLVSCSQEVLPVAPIAEREKVLIFTSYANASGITDAGEYIFRNAHTNRDMARLMTEVARTFGQRVAIISEQSEFASDLRDLFLQSFEGIGGTVGNTQDFPQGSKDFRTQISKMLNGKPDVIVANPNSPAAGIAILKQLREAGYKGQIMGNFFGGSREVQALKEAEGMIYVSDPIIAESPAKKVLFEKYKTKYGRYPDLEWPVGARYDAVYILKQAIETVGGDPTAIKNYLYEMPDFKGIIGTYRFDKNGDITNVVPSVAQIRNRKAVHYSI